MKIRRKASEENGAVALMTLAFMMILGVTVILFVWSLGIITGAYNALYIANQSAAVAAASATDMSSSDGVSGQLSYNCLKGGIGEELCQDGFGRVPTPLAAAKIVMQKSLAREPFGLRYGDNVKIAAEGDLEEAGFSSIMAYNVSRPAGDIKRVMEEQNKTCVVQPGAIAGTVPDAFEGEDGGLHCWQVTERGVPFPKKYNSGVLVRSVADLNVFNCDFVFCKTKIEVISAATQEQVTSPEDLDQYFYYNPRD